MNATPDDIEYERPLDFVDVLYVIGDLVDDLEREHDELRQLERDDNDGYPKRSLGGGGRPTNRRHNFDTGEDNPADGTGELVPQHSDPVGELASRQDDRTQYTLIRRRALEDVCGAMRLLESARSRYANTRRPPTNNDRPRTRDHCWPCMDNAGVNVPTYRDSDPIDAGTNRPRCRNHYDYAREHHRDAPQLFAEWWFNRRRITTSMWDQAHQRDRDERTKKRKKKKR